MMFQAASIVGFFTDQSNKMGLDPKLLEQLVTMHMPFGKYKGRLLCNLPISYLEWFKRKGFPKAKLGMLLQTMYEIKLNGLDYLLQPLKELHQAKDLPPFRR